MWSAPVERRNADGSKYNLVLLDTEGIDAWDQTGQYSTQIFSLAVLLSSLFVYNQMGGIDEAAIDHLSLVTEMTKHVRVRAGSAGGENASELADFTPSFLWLLRDFYLTLEENGRKLSPREYLETALRNVEGTGKSIEAKNEIRTSIKSLFPDRDCFSLVRPMHDEKELARLDSIPPAQMRPEFREGLAQLTRVIFSRAQPKRLGNQIITGPMLAALTSAYVDAINNGAVPTIATAWQGVAEAECRRAADAAERAYQQAFNKDVDAEEVMLEAEHQRALGVAQKAFDEVAVGEESVRRANEQRFRDRTAHDFLQFKQGRLANAALECEKLITSVTNQLMQMARDPAVTLEALQAQLTRFQDQYKASKTATGPLKWQRWSDFERETYGGIVRDFVTRAQKENEARLAAAAQRSQDLESRLKMSEAKLAEAERQLASLRAEVARDRVTRDQSGARVQALEQQLAEALQRKEQDKAATQAEAQARLERAAAEHRAEVTRLALQVQQAERQLADAQRSSGASQSELDSLRRQLAAAGTDTDAWIATYRQAEQDKLAASAARDTAQGEVLAKEMALQDALRAKAAAEQKLSAHEAEMQRLHAKITDLGNETAALRAGAAAPAAPMEVEDGYASAGEGEDLNPNKMTINEIKQWLTEKGHEDKAWELTNKRAKKPQYVEVMKDVLGR
ncbi:hypothetical protein WJX72_009644 [[Myrmecia] bisecta]|uniref:GB1/RHD3-type G domain-containing protein n=1 Tax=[Myrmecia] bisecta TaxID=41462 RepID=A0AAW1QG29_9CHLO